MPLDNIRVVLVRTFHPGNIGSTARSMKTMGLNNLHLVAPKNFPNQDADKMAAGASELVAQALIHTSIETAVQDCTVVAATTARVRGFDLPELNPEQAAQLLLSQSERAPVALVFGPERMGLHNDDLRLANYRITIPANPEYSSLNLASAVQILSYELFKASVSTNSTPSELKADPLPSNQEQERFFDHFETVAREISFFRPHEGETMQRIRRLFKRSQLRSEEISLLRGFLTSIQKTLRGEKR